MITLQELRKTKIALMKNKTDDTVSFKINILNDVLTESKSFAVVNKITNVDELTTGQVIKVIEKVSKQLDKEIDSLKQFKDTTKQEIQKEFLKQWLPQKLNEEETTIYVKSLVDKGFKLPEIMKEAKTKYDTLDLSLVSKIARELL